MVRAPRNKKKGGRRMPDDLRRPAYLPRTPGPSAAESYSGRTVQQGPEEAMAPALMGAGMNAEWARLFQELTHGLNAGIVVWEGGHPLWRGETDVQTVLSTLIGK